VGSRHHERDRKDHERGSTRPGEERERKRSDCNYGRWEAGGLPTCRHDARRGTKREPAAAAAEATVAQVQTADQTAAKTAARVQAKVSTHTHTRETLGDRPTPTQESEGTRQPKPRQRPRPRPDGGIKHGRATADMKKRRERTALQ